MSESVEGYKEWVLEPEAEYRFELDPDATLAIRLVKGHAEIFGSELAEGINYLFFGECKAAVFTWHGASLHVAGHPSTEYVSDETPMAAYMNLHLAFEQMRVCALSKTRNSPVREDTITVPDNPPRVLVLGPENAGKTTLCKILANYAVRAGQGWEPMFVNVDPAEGGWTVPGAISACPVSTPIPTQSPANTLGSTATTAPTALSSSALLPLVYWYGRADVKQNAILFDRLIRNLGENARLRHDNDINGQCSGIIMDTPAYFATGLTGAANDKKYAFVKTCVDAFQINVIIVVGHEKLNVEMQRMFGSKMNVVKVPKSGGVVDLDSSYRERVHHYQIQGYMYGQYLALPAGLSSSKLSGGSDDTTELGDRRLSPISTVIAFDDLTIYRIGSEIAPTSALPIGATRTVSELLPVRVDPAQRGSGLQNAVLALLAPLNADENERYSEELIDLPVSAFLVITAVDVSNRKMTVLMPSPGPVSGRIALIGYFEWVDR